MNADALLMKARYLIADPKHWTQEAYARNDCGIAVDACSPRACQWDAVGALYAIADYSTSLSIIAAAKYRLSVVAIDTYGEGTEIQHVNDGKVFAVRLFQRARSHRAVLRLYEDAIALNAIPHRRAAYA